jgi:hypothetical protein
MVIVLYLFIDDNFGIGSKLSNNYLQIYYNLNGFDYMKIFISVKENHDWARFKVYIFV